VYGLERSNRVENLARRKAEFEETKGSYNRNIEYRKFHKKRMGDRYFQPSHLSVQPTLIATK
jgi:hypothetical protein